LDILDSISKEKI